MKTPFMTGNYLKYRNRVAQKRVRLVSLNKDMKQTVNLYLMKLKVCHQKIKQLLLYKIRFPVGVYSLGPVFLFWC